jgi:pseudouridine synthase
LSPKSIISEQAYWLCQYLRGRAGPSDGARPAQAHQIPSLPVGRLDWNSEGLLLLTNDGELAQRLMHPRFHIRRTYLAKVEGIPTAQSLLRLTSAAIQQPPKSVAQQRGSSRSENAMPG